MERGGLLRRQAPGARAGVADGGHITYMSDDSMREVRPPPARQGEFSFGFDVDFEVESYLRYRGNQFVNRFDANITCTSQALTISTLRPATGR